MPQLSYEKEPKKALKGMKCEPFSFGQVDSHVCQEEVKFGFGVIYAATPTVGSKFTEVEPMDTDGVAMGVAVSSQPQEQDAYSEVVEASYKAKRTGAIMVAGRVWMEASEALAVGDEVQVEAAGTVKAGAMAAGSYFIALARSVAEAAGDLVEVELIPTIVKA